MKKYKLILRFIFYLSVLFFASMCSAQNNGGNLVNNWSNTQSNVRYAANGFNTRNITALRSMDSNFIWFDRWSNSLYYTKKDGVIRKLVDSSSALGMFVRLNPPAPQIGNVNVQGNLTLNGSNHSITGTLGLFSQINQSYAVAGQYQIANNTNSLAMTKSVSSGSASYISGVNGALYGQAYTDAPIFGSFNGTYWTNHDILVGGARRFRFNFTGNDSLMSNLYLNGNLSVNGTFPTTTDFSYPGAQISFSGGMNKSGIWQSAGSNILKLADWNTGVYGLTIDISTGAGEISGVLKSSQFYTDVFGTSVPNSVATTLFNISAAGKYEVFVSVPNAGVTNYTASATILSEGTGCRLVNVNNGSLLTISLSGCSLQATQNSGTTVTVQSTYQRL